MPNQPTILVISQVYVPDPASVGQHMHDAAAELARRGHRVVVYCSRAGYDDPSKKYPWKETREGVTIRRLPLSSFGKSSILIRLLAQSLFMWQATTLGQFCAAFKGGPKKNGLKAILVSTSPPMASIGAWWISILRRAPVTFWAMDLNPDQMIAMGKITENSLPARLFNFLNRRILKRSRGVVALDRFMAERLNRKVPASVNLDAKMSIQPPWPHEGHVEVVAHADNPFRKAHGLDGKFVVMYSGNHAPSNPLKTLLDAAARLKDDPRFVFMFIGGGLLKKDVEAAIAAGATNIRSLPYQPMSELKYSLSAADVHVVSIGNDVVGIVHPCKVYGAMAVARPILFFGPKPSHVSDLIDNFDIGWSVEHGDVDGAEGALNGLADLAANEPESLAAMGARAKQAVETTYSKAALMAMFCDVVEGKVLGPAGSVVVDAAGSGVALKAPTSAAPA